MKSSIYKILRKERVNRKGEAPVYLRITKNRRTSFISTGDPDNLIGGITFFASLESEYRMLAEVYPSQGKQYSLLNILQLAYLKKKEMYSIDEKPLIQQFAKNGAWLSSGDKNSILEKLSRIVLTEDTNDEEIVQILSTHELLSRNAVKEIIEKRGFRKFYSCLKQAVNDGELSTEVQSEVSEIIKKTIPDDYKEIKDKINFINQYCADSGQLELLISDIISEFEKSAVGIDNQQRRWGILVFFSQESLNRLVPIYIKTKDDTNKKTAEHSAYLKSLIHSKYAPAFNKSVKIILNALDNKKN